MAIKCHILRHDSLLRITLEGQIQGKKAYGRPRTMLLDGLLKTEEGNISYEELKISAQDRSSWSQWRWKPAIWQSTTQRDYTAVGVMWYKQLGRRWGCRFDAVGVTNQPHQSPSRPRASPTGMTCLVQCVQRNRISLRDKQLASINTVYIFLYIYWASLFAKKQR